MAPSHVHAMKSQLEVILLSVYNYSSLFHLELWFFGDWDFKILFRARLGSQVLKSTYCCLFVNSLMVKNVIALF